MSGSKMHFGGCVFPPPNLGPIFCSTELLQSQGEGDRGRAGEGPWPHQSWSHPWKCHWALKAAQGVSLSCPQQPKSSKPQPHLCCGVTLTSNKQQLQQILIVLFVVDWLFKKFLISRGSISAAVRTSRQLFPVFFCVLRKSTRGI